MSIAGFCCVELKNGQGAERVCLACGLLEDQLVSDRPKPYRRMIAYVVVALIVAFGLAAWYSYHVHPGDAAPTPAATSTPGN